MIPAHQDSEESLRLVSLYIAPLSGTHRYISEIFHSSNIPEVEFSAQLCVPARVRPAVFQEESQQPYYD